MNCAIATDVKSTKMTSATPITSFRTAYKIGFSVSLSTTYYSGYSELTRWIFEEKNKRKLQKSFLRGCEQGNKLARIVRRELEAEAKACMPHRCDGTVLPQECY